MARGAYLALLGIDGMGKSTLARELAERCEELGQPVRTISWRQFIESPDEPGDASWPKDDLRHLWLQIFRLYYGGATIDGGARDLPRTYEELNARGGTEHLADARITDLRPHGPLAATLLEIAGNVLLQRDVIDRWVAEGCLVLQESYGFKHAVKELLLTEALDPALATQTEVLMRFATEFFGRCCVPDVGVHVTGDPMVALKWRTAQSGRTSPFENYSIAGGDPEDSFLAMQTRCVTVFDAFATEHGWARLEMRDEPVERNVERMLDLLGGTPVGDLLRLPAVAA